MSTATRKAPAALDPWQWDFDPAWSSKEDPVHKLLTVDGRPTHVEVQDASAYNAGFAVADTSDIRFEVAVCDTLEEAKAAAIAYFKSLGGAR